MKLKSESQTVSSIIGVDFVGDAVDTSPLIFRKCAFDTPNKNMKVAEVFYFNKPFS